jgi:hypothetical protein
LIRFVRRMGRRIAAILAAARWRVSLSAPVFSLKGSDPLELLAKAAGVFFPVIFALSVMFNIIYAGTLRLPLLWVYTFSDYLTGTVVVGSATVLISAFVFILFSLIRTLCSLFRRPDFGFVPGLGFAAMLTVIVTWLYAVQLSENSDFLARSIGLRIMIMISLVTFLSYLVRRSIPRDVRGYVTVFMLAACMIAKYADDNAFGALNAIKPAFRFTYEDAVHSGVLLRGLDKVAVVRIPELNEIALIEWNDFKTVAYGPDRSVAPAIGSNTSNSASWQWTWPPVSIDRR